MNNAFSLLPLLLALAGVGTAAQAQAPAAGDVAKGAAKAAMCIGCHGIVGYQATFPEVHKVPMIAGQMWFDWQPQGHSRVPGKGGLTLAGLVIGGVSALFGIGGGSLTVPFLCWCKVRMQEAVATAAACGFPIALVGALGYVYQGWLQPDLPQYALGYVYLPAVLGIGISSVVFARFGAQLAHRWPAATLKRVFAGFLVFIGAVLLAGMGR